MDEYLEKTVAIVTGDGKYLTGQLRGFDQSTNVILEQCVEWVVNEDQGEMEQIPVGLYIVRGSNIAFVSEVDVEEQTSLMTRLNRASSAMIEPLRPLRH